MGAMAHADGDDGERSGARAGGKGHDCEAEGSDRSERAACVREVHGEQQHRGESVHRNVSHECVPDLPSKIFRGAQCRVAGAGVECICWTCWDFGMGLGPRSRRGTEELAS